MIEKIKEIIRQLLAEELTRLLPQIIAEELDKALTREMTVEYGPRKPGDPEKTIKNEMVNLVDFWTIYAPRIEGALRGMQEDVTRTVNRVNEQGEMIEAVGRTLIGIEEPAKKIAMLSDFIRNHKTLANPDATHKHFLPDTVQDAEVIDDESAA